jgi:hypothetical protein
MVRLIKMKGGDSLSKKRVYSVGESLSMKGGESVNKARSGSVGKSLAVKRR